LHLAGRPGAGRPARSYAYLTIVPLLLMRDLIEVEKAWISL
jgi:hypothetical protein